MQRPLYVINETNLCPGFYISIHKNMSLYGIDLVWNEANLTRNLPNWSELHP